MTEQFGEVSVHGEEGSDIVTVVVTRLTDDGVEQRGAVEMSKDDWRELVASVAEWL
jgi:hypothetical protein